MNALEFRERKIGTATRRFRSGSTHQQSPKFEVNVALVGPLGSGKSALTVRYVAQRFIGEYDPNLEDTYSRVDTFAGHSISVRAMDTSSDHVWGNQYLQEEENRYLQWADCILLVYSVTSRASFETMQDYIDAWRVQARDVLCAPQSRRSSRRLSIHDFTSPASPPGMPHRSLTPTPSWERACSEAPSTSGREEQLEEENPRAPALILVGGKGDLEGAREVPRSEGEALARQNGLLFQETSSAEDPDSVRRVFQEALREGLIAQEKTRGWREDVSREKFPSSLLQALSDSSLCARQSQGLLFHRRVHPAAATQQHHYAHITAFDPSDSSSVMNSGSSPQLLSPQSAEFSSCCNGDGSMTIPPRKDSKERFQQFFKSRSFKGIFQ